MQVGGWGVLVRLWVSEFLNSGEFGCNIKPNWAADFVEDFKGKAVHWSVPSLLFKDKISRSEPESLMQLSIYYYFYFIFLLAWEFLIISSKCDKHSMVPRMVLGENVVFCTWLMLKQKLWELLINKYRAVLLCSVSGIQAWEKDLFLRWSEVKLKDILSLQWVSISCQIQRASLCCLTGPVLWFCRGKESRGLLFPLSDAPSCTQAY